MPGIEVADDSDEAGDRPREKKFSGVEARGETNGGVFFRLSSILHGGTITSGCG
jgi:hypothetical protein